MRLVVGLDEITDTDTGRVGGKAVALAALHRASVTVPLSWCLTTEAYEVFVDQSGLRSVIHQELGRKRFADMRWEELWDASLRIRNHFVRAAMPEAVVSEVEVRLQGELGNARLAVRSSAPSEDSAGASFAGLHDSFIGVQGLEATCQAIQEVWASLWTDRALLYRRELGIDVESSSMAVLLQRLAEGSRSGIGFGVHPLDPDLVAVEAVYGLNQGLVDGTIEPDRWSLRRATAQIVEHVAPPERQQMVLRGSETAVEQLPPEQGDSPPLNGEELVEVYQSVVGAGDLFGTPQDVEWTLNRGKLVILQSRPVTTASSPEGDKRAWYLSLTRSLPSLMALRDRVEHELLPAMNREATELGEVDLGSLDSRTLADEIERRRRAHDRWVETYTQDFIPLAHGIRLFGQFYNDLMRPEDPYEFIELLTASPLLSVRRNQGLLELARRVRNDAELRRRLEAGQRGDAGFEDALEEFDRDFGDAAFASQKCFGERGRLIRLLLSMAAAPAIAEPSSAADVDSRSTAFLSSVGEDRQHLAERLLDLGRASYRLRDDDNIHLSRLETLVLDAVEEGRRRLGADLEVGMQSSDLDLITQALRHPNLVVEPRPPGAGPVVERGFQALPRQLVGQPAGPGIASGRARRIEEAEDLFRFEAGEVLVCDAVDPNMTFVVPMAAAIVERRGGMLIHGAIIAREYGLPCVTGVPDATAMVNTGDSLTVDGYLGIVTVVRD